jgi:acyl carrier protein
MTREEFREKAAEILRLTPSLLNDDTDLMNDLGIDSLKLLQLVNGIEVFYNIEIDDAKIDSLTCFGDAYTYVKHLTDQRAK